MLAFTQTQYQERLRTAGYKLTKARRVIWDAIEAHHGHFTSSEIVDAVNNIDSSIGRASVFRTLDLLTQLGIIRPTYIDSNVAPRYVLLPDGHHHHIICTNCSRVIEFEDCGLDALAKTLEDRYQLRLTGHLLEFYGVCENCRSA
ncbi:MAG: Fur family transcriptional regulator [Aggregatilineales bacterium]